MRVLRTTGLAAALLLLAACVTINIYFPAAQAEKAAEKIVEDILGDKPPVPPVPAGDDRGAALQHDWQRSIARRVLDFFIPAAQAAAPDFTVNTPLIRKLQAAMKQRNGELSRYYANGAIGFTRDARVAIHDATAISLKERNRVKQLIAAENRDRDALYRAIADANGHPEWEPEVRATFARTWIQKAARGWWYQDGNGRWKQK